MFKKKDQYEYKLLFKIPTNTNPSESIKIKSSLFPSSLRRQWLIVGLQKILNEAERLKDYQEIYFVHTMDFRGRIYSKSTYLNPQGADLCRGLILFGKAKPIENENAIGWLANHGARTFGGALGRESYDNRRKWVDENEAIIRAIAEAPLDNLGFIEKVNSSSRWAFIAWCQEWSAFLAAGKGYESRLPVAVDGTCNGFQHFAALTRSFVLARNVNLISSEKPNDIYAFVADSVKSKVEALPKTSSDLGHPIKEMLGRYYEYQYRGQYIEQHGCEPGKSNDSKIPGNECPFESSWNVQCDSGNEEQNIVFEGETPPDAVEDEIEINDAPNYDDPEKKLLDFKAIEPGKAIDEKEKKKLLKCLQQCRNHLADAILRDLTCRPKPVITLSRELFKPIVMTFPYSATHSGNVEAIYNILIENCLFDDDKSYYPKDVTTIPCYRSLEYILAHAICRFARNAINNKMPQAKKIMSYLKQFVPQDDSKTTIRWHTPCNLTVRQRYPKIATARRKKVEYSGEVFYIRKLDEATKADIRKHRQGISPNFIHSCDAAHLMKTINGAFECGITHFLAIHDSYSTHASDMHALNRILREKFVEMYTKENLLEKLRTDLGASSIKPFFTDSQDLFDIQQVLESEYFFS